MFLQPVKPAGPSHVPLFCPYTTLCSPSGGCESDDFQPARLLVMSPSFASRPSVATYQLSTRQSQANTPPLTHTKRLPEPYFPNGKNA